jgi:hypothetical protein
VSDPWKRWCATATISMLVTALVFTACSGSESTPNAEPIATTAPAAPPEAPTTAASEPDDGSTTTSDSPAISGEAPTSADEQVGPVSAYPWLPDLVLLTAPSDDVRPLLSWEPIDGATVYAVTVTAPTGLAYWAWRTDTTSVHLGGDPRLDDGQSGPSTVPGMTWSVLAFDADGRPIAASVEEPLHL